MQHLNLTTTLLTINKQQIMSLLIQIHSLLLMAKIVTKWWDVWPKLNFV